LDQFVLVAGDPVAGQGSTQHVGFSLQQFHLKKEFSYRQGVNN